MTETEHLIRQAAREIGITLNIDRNSKFTVEESTDEPGTYKVSFLNRKGDNKTIIIPMTSQFSTIHAALKSAWRGISKTEMG